MIKEQIHKLLQLQEVDLEIIDLENKKEELPKKIEALREEARSINEQLKSLEEELKQIQVEHKEKELELQSKEEDIKKYQTQLYQIKTNKEYTSLQSEIGGLKADCSLLEEGIINSLDKIDEVNKKIEEERKIQQAEDEKLKEQEISISSMVAQTEQEAKVLKEKRTHMLKGLDKKIYAKYERVLRARNTAALVPVLDHSCGGCHMGLPPQVVDNLNISDELILCENCSRILYLPR